jgi:hypothetical protein
MRKHVFFVMAAAFLMAFSVGCKKPAATSVSATGEKKLTLPKLSDYSVARNGKVEVTVKIERDGFRDPVIVSFDNVPEGVQLTDKDSKIAAEAKSGTFTLQAKDNAPLVTDHLVRVAVTGPDKLTATDTFKLTVKEK